jgi:hypothetical protein
VKRILTAATLTLLAVLLAAPAVRAGDSPEGKWWKNPRVTAELGLSPDQAAEIEKIFVHSRPKLIDLRGDLEKKQLELQDAMEDKPPTGPPSKESSRSRSRVPLKTRRCSSHMKRSQAGSVGAAHAEAAGRREQMQERRRRLQRTACAASRHPNR